MKRLTNKKNTLVIPRKTLNNVNLESTLVTKSVVESFSGDQSVVFAYIWTYRQHISAVLLIGWDALGASTRECPTSWLHSLYKLAYFHLRMNAKGKKIASRWKQHTSAQTHTHTHKKYMTWRYNSANNSTLPNVAQALHMQTQPPRRRWMSLTTSTAALDVLCVLSWCANVCVFF